MEVFDSQEFKQTVTCLCSVSTADDLERIFNQLCRVGDQLQSMVLSMWETPNQTYSLVVDDSLSEVVSHFFLCWMDEICNNSAFRDMKCLDRTFILKIVTIPHIGNNAPSSLFSYTVPRFKCLNSSSDAHLLICLSALGFEPYMHSNCIVSVLVSKIYTFLLKASSITSHSKCIARSFEFLELLCNVARSIFLRKRPKNRHIPGSLTSIALCINTAILSLPIDISVDNSTSAKAISLCHSLGYLGKNLAEEGGFLNISLEYTLSSLLMVTCIMPDKLDLWYNEFFHLRHFDLLLKSHFGEVLPALFTAVRTVCLRKSQDLTYFRLLTDLVKRLEMMSNPSASHLFIQLLVLGKSSLLSQIRQLVPSHVLEPFIWSATKLAVSSQQISRAVYTNALASTYIPLPEHNSFENVLTSLIELDKIDRSPQEAIYIIQALSEVCAKSYTNVKEFRCMMVRKLIHLLLTWIKRNDGSLNVHLSVISAAFIRLLSGDHFDAQTYQMILEAISSLNGFLHTVDMNCISVASIVEALANYLGYTNLSGLVFENGSSFPERIVECILQFIMRYIREYSRSTTPRCHEEVFWTSLWCVVARGNFWKVIGHIPSQREISTKSFVLSVTKLVLHRLKPKSEMGPDLQTALIGVLMELSHKANTFFEMMPLDCLNLGLISSLFGEISMEEKSEALKEPEIRTLSVPESDYVIEERRLTQRMELDDSGKRRTRLFVFLLHQILGSFDLKNIQALSALVEEANRMRIRGLSAEDSSELMPWLSESLSKALEILQSLHLQEISRKADSVVELLTNLIELLCIGGGQAGGLRPIVQLTPAQLERLLRVCVHNASRGVKLHVLQLLMKWAGQFDPLEPEGLLSRPSNWSIGAGGVGGKSNDVFRSWACACASIPLEHWGANSGRALPVLTIWPSFEDVQHSDLEATAASGFTLVLWYRLAPQIECVPCVDINLPLSEATFLDLASRELMLHLFTLEETSDRVTSSDQSDCWSIEVWILPTTRGVYVRIRKSHMGCILSGKVYLRNILSANDWSHLMISVRWKKSSHTPTGIVSVNNNVVMYSEATFELDIHETPLTREERTVDGRKALTLWTGHRNLTSVDETGLLMGDLHVFTGNLLAKVPPGDTESYLRDLALYLLLTGPNWVEALASATPGSWQPLAARGRCYLNALIRRVPPSGVVDVLTRAERILDPQDGRLLWIHTLRRLVKHNLLISIDTSLIDSVIWSVRVPSYDCLPANPVASTFCTRKSDMECFRIPSRLWVVGSTSNNDNSREFRDAESVEEVMKWSLDAVITSLGSIDFAFFLAGVAICENENDPELISTCCDLIFTLRRHSAIAAEHFHRPLSEEDLFRGCDIAFDRLHVTSNGLCLLAALLNQLHSGQVGSGLLEVFNKNAYLYLPNAPPLLIDPELVACQLIFSSANSLPAIFMALGKCLIAANHETDRIILSYNTCIVDRYRIFELAVIAFRLCFFASESDTNGDLTFEASIESLSHLMSQRLALQAPMPKELLAFLLNNLVLVDPYLYHCAATRAFDGGGVGDTVSTMDFVKLERQHLRSIRIALGWSGTLDTSTPVESDPAKKVSTSPPILPLESGGDDLVPPDSPSLDHPSPALPACIPWIPLQPALTKLEGASAVEAATLARFREQITSGEEPTDSCLSPAGLFGSCSSLIDFEELDLGECEGQDKRTGWEGEDVGTRLTRSLSMPEILLRLQGEDEEGEINLIEKSNFISLREGLTSPERFDASVQTEAPQSTSPLKLTQRHQFANTLLSALTDFWRTSAENYRHNLSEHELRIPLLLPPFWLIYHLGGHPCVRFREHAVSLYAALLKVDTWQVKSDLIGADRILALQLLSSTSQPAFQHLVGINGTDHQKDVGGCSNADFFACGPFAHLALTSKDLIATVCKTGEDEMNLKRSEERGKASTHQHSATIPAAISLCILASSVVDFVSFFRVLDEKHITDDPLSVDLANYLSALLDKHSSFLDHAKSNQAFCCSFRDRFSLRVLVQMVFFLQSADVSEKKLCDIGVGIARLLSSLVARPEELLAFTDVKWVAEQLCTAREVAGPGKSSDRSLAANRLHVVRETLLRVLFAFVGRVLRVLGKDSTSKETLHAQLLWGAQMIESALLYKGSTELDPLTADASDDGSCQHPTNIRYVEKALVTFFVNTASHAMRNSEPTVWIILSSSLLRMLHGWCEALLEALTISKTGLWLLELIAQEPYIIGAEAVSACGDIVNELRSNLQMLGAVFSTRPETKYSKHKGSFGTGDSGSGDPQSSRVSVCESIEGNRMAYSKVTNAVRVLTEWFDSLCEDFESLPHMPPTYKLRRNAWFVQEPITHASVHSEQLNWLTPLREANDTGQRNWSMLVSQYRYTLDVLAPFYWTQLSGMLSHESSIFSDLCPKPAFSHVDTFENDSRQRCRRRPVVVWIDDRFVRAAAAKSLGQYQRRHPLSRLMLQQTMHTPSWGRARERCRLSPRAQATPSCQALFAPSATAAAAAERCLGVWPVRLIALAHSHPLDGDLSLDSNSLRLVLDFVHEAPPTHMDSRGSIGQPPIHGIDGDAVQGREVLTCPLCAIVRVEERRFELRDLALEIFFQRSCNVPPIMIAFRCIQDRDTFLQCVIEACSSLHPLPPSHWWRLGSATSRRPSNQALGRRPVLRLRDLCETLLAPFPTSLVGAGARERLLDAQVAWLRGGLSNFDYLMALNTAAGRTYNDITQYPIFPWVLADYESEVLDLRNAGRTFRRLNRPISVQNEVRAEAVLRHYEELKAQQEEVADAGQRSLLCPAFHYPSFCSNEAIILHLLCRLIPYTFRLIQFQDGNFDDPNRLFCSVASEWSLATSSGAYVKELIPEFFSRPDVFVNYENFDFGTRQDGEVVDLVRLPPWAKGDPRLFVLVNRAALESPYVTAHLPEWIDLVFGYKQTGSLAERAINLYHPFTYFGAIDVDGIEDPVRRAAVQSMIRNYGQVPCQLFPSHPHPRRTTSLESQTSDNEYHLRHPSTDGAAAPSNLFPLSSLIHFLLSRQTMRQPRTKPADEVIAMVKSLSVEEEEDVDEPVVTASLVPLTAGAPLDTVKGLKWGKWAGSPLSQPLGISWYAKLQSDASLPCRLQGTISDRARSPWTLLVTDANSSLLLLRLPSYPLLLVKMSTQQSGVISIIARRFLEGSRLYRLTIPLPCVESLSIFKAVSSVEARVLTRDDQVHLVVGTKNGGVYVRVISVRDIVAGFVDAEHDDEQIHQRHQLAGHKGNLFYPDTISLHGGPFRTLSSQRSMRPAQTSIMSTTWRCLVGHVGSRITEVDVCLQYGLIATGDASGRVLVWDLSSTALIAPLEMDESSEVFGAVCGLAFARDSGEFVVARTGPYGARETWIGLFTADCRQGCSRILDFQAEAGFTTKVRPVQPSSQTGGLESLPIIFSASRGYEVGCVLIGGVNGCLVWLSSWTLDTASVMKLDQPSPCPIVALSFAPLSSPDLQAEGNDRAQTDASLYIADSQGWMYYLEPGGSTPSRRLRLNSPSRGPSLPQGNCETSSLNLPGVWLS